MPIGQVTGAQRDLQHPLDFVEQLDRLRGRRDRAC